MRSATSYNTGRLALGANRQTYHYRLVFGSQQEVNVHRGRLPGGTGPLG